MNSQAKNQPSMARVRDYFLALQTRLCEALETLDAGTGSNAGSNTGPNTGSNAGSNTGPNAGFNTGFSSQEITTPGGGMTRPRILEGGRVIERGAVQFTHSIGDALPAAASERNPQLAGRRYEATAISMILHPRNPYAPTCHANLRFFLVAAEHWHFGGGFDLTPYYPFAEDVLHWHQTAEQACRPYGEDLYPRFKQWCDDYFYLPHRTEPRGVGGLFLDDWKQGGFEQSFALLTSIGEHILPAYLPILQKRINTPYGEREREFQLYRRGRYAEFNLAIDRGTRYGLQSGHKIESVLASMPPMATWKYDWQPEPGSPEALLYDDYLQPRDWLTELTGAET